MVLDYKDYSKGFRLKHKERHYGRYLLPVLVLVLAYGVLYFWVGHRLSNGRALVEKGDIAAAEEQFLSAKTFRIRGRLAEDGLGIVELHRGNMTAATDHLLRGGNSVFKPAAVIALFTGQGKYEQAALYGEYARGWSKDPAVAIERSAALVGMQKIAEAEKILSAIKPSPELAARHEAVVKVLASARKSGRFTLLADRANSPVVTYPYGEPPLEAPVEAPGGLRFDGALTHGDYFNHTLLTIDREYQEAASAVLGYAGAFVVVSPTSGEILAAVSNPLPGDKSLNFALEGQFEPGSIIKLITLSAALRTGLDLGTIFPFKCTGMLNCDGQWFYDWAIHGEMKDISQATAESCNIAFGKIALAVGPEAIKRELSLYGFGRDITGAAPALRFGSLTDVPPGSFNTARMSVGLDHLTISTLHGAMLAAAFAGDGTMMMPRIVREKRTILQEPYFRSQATMLLSTELAQKNRQTITAAMRRVVESEMGTGRRVVVDGLPIAIKTGTSGKREFGLDSVIIGFAPADSPKIAFCLYAHSAGKAELEGTRIVREFLLRVRDRLLKP